jgi:hypothetical protein
VAALGAACEIYMPGDGESKCSAGRFLGGHGFVSESATWRPSLGRFVPSTDESTGPGRGGRYWASEIVRAHRTKLLVSSKYIIFTIHLDIHYI